MNKAYKDYPSNLKGYVKIKESRTKHSRRVEKARQWCGVVIVVGALLVYAVFQ